MTTPNKYIYLLLLLSSAFSFGQSQQKFNSIYDLIQHKSFFEAKKEYEINKRLLSPTHQMVTEAHLYNAFNKLEASNEKIKTLVKKHAKQLPDSLLLDLYEIKADNSLKLFEYKEAKNATEYILNQYASRLTAEETDDYKNSLEIWSDLENQPKQQLIITADNKIKIKKDKVGLDNLTIKVNSDSLDFVFDTGANLSTTIQSVAKKLKMKFLPSAIEVDAITGKKVIAQLAVCDKMMLGNIEIRNAVFLVFNDEDLGFPQINYQIYGILGFPVIEACKEIQITKDRYFIVPKKETPFTGTSNMAMDQLTPLIAIESKQYTFDTGANATILYPLYYAAHKKEIDASYQKMKFSFGGAGGAEEHEGYAINYTAELSGQKISLEKISLIIDAPQAKKNYFYGNIGQDVIRQFDSLTLNFNQMFIKLN